MCRDRVINALLNNLLDRYISWPLNQNIQADIAVKLHEKKGFPGIMGCIDETHIKIKAPHEYSQRYANRKGYHSVILQAVCSLAVLLVGLEVVMIPGCWMRNSQFWVDGPRACS